MPGLLTGNIRLGAEIKLRRYGLWEFFETGGFADDSEDRNHIAAAALERGRRVLGGNLRGEEILVVGDTPHDVRCGKFIGAKVLAVATGGAKLEELQNHKPDWAVEDLTRVSARRGSWLIVQSLNDSSAGRFPMERFNDCTSSISMPAATAAATMMPAAAAVAGRSFAAGAGRGEGGKFLGQFLRAAMRTPGVFPIRRADEDFAVAPALPAMKFVNRHE